MNLNKLIQETEKEFDNEYGYLTNYYNGCMSEEEYEELKYFISQSIKAGYELAIKDVEKWVNDKDKGGRYCSAVGNFVYMEELNELLQSLLKGKL